MADGFHFNAIFWNSAPGTHEGMYFKNGRKSTQYFPGIRPSANPFSASSAASRCTLDGSSTSIPYTSLNIKDPNELQTSSSGRALRIQGIVYSQACKLQKVLGMMEQRLQEFQLLLFCNCGIALDSDSIEVLVKSTTVFAPILTIWHHSEGPIPA